MNIKHELIRYENTARHGPIIVQIREINNQIQIVLEEMSTANPLLKALEDEGKSLDITFFLFNENYLIYRSDGI